MFKKTFFQIHWFLGITAGLVLSIMGVTGAIYSYEQQILKWINTDSYTVQAQSGPKLSPAELYQHFKQQNPEMQINSVSLDASPTGSSTVNIAKEGARRGYNMMVNPYTAEVLPEIKGRVLPVHTAATPLFNHGSCRQADHRCLCPDADFLCLVWSLPTLAKTPFSEAVASCEAATERS